MTIDLVFGVVAVVVVVIVFSARGRQQKGTTTSRGHVLQTISPIVAGTFSDEMQLAGTYRGHPVEGSLRTTGRVDTIIPAPTSKCCSWLCMASQSKTRGAFLRRSVVAAG